MGKGGCLALGPANSDEPVPPEQPRNPRKLISAALLATKCTPSQCWIVHRNVVYDATAWLSKHPGGMRTILSNSGRDATAVMLAMHDETVLDRSLRRMKKVGVYAGGSEALVPASFDTSSLVQEEKKEEVLSAAASDELRKASLERDFRKLDEWLVREGWYTPRPGLYWVAVLRAIAIFITSVGLMLSGGTHGGLVGHPFLGRLAVTVGSLLLGAFFQQMAFFGHDAGHGSINGDFSIDGCLGLIVGNATAGIDISWWKSTHNVHHGATNSMHDDPDIQHLPLFCFDEKMVSGGGGRVAKEDNDGLWSTYHGRFMPTGSFSRYLMQYQHLYFYPVMAFARFNLYIQSMIHLVRICPFGAAQNATTKSSPEFDSSATKKEPYDWPTATPAMWIAQVASLSVFYGLWYMLLSQFDRTNAAICLILSHVVAGVLHVQILLSHCAMHYHQHAAGVEIDDDAVVSFQELQALTTMDISCHPSVDWLHGGLQFQLEHHLFPRIPKFRLRELIPFVDAIFAKHGVPVVRESFWDANVMVMRHMQTVGKTISRVKVD